MKEITLEYGKQYLLDRVLELRNQIPNGDPFVFLGAACVRSAVKELVPCSYWYSIELNKKYKDLFSALEVSSSSFSLNGFDVELTHDSSKHLSVKPNGRTVYAAKETLDYLQDIIEYIFKEFETDKVLASMAYYTLNTDKFIGLRD